MVVAAIIGLGLGMTGGIMVRSDILYISRCTISSHSFHACC